MRSELHLCLLAKQLSCKLCKCSLEVGKRDISVDHKPLNLMERRRMCGVYLICTKHTPRRDHSYWKSAFFHLMHLYARCLCSEQDIAVDVKSILLILCRMVCRNIERLEVIIIFLHLGTFYNLISHADKDALYLLECDCVGMAVPHTVFLRGQCHVNHLRLHARLPKLSLHAGLCLIEHPLNLCSGFIYKLSDFGPVLRRHVLHTL